ncbi:MAG: hypothetical protein II477_12560 [Lachnospiraceae bacterium]|nr:hypothetical protein [Lachnospiraceae bacterium]MBQ3906139.1 hypothetical protein [Lachnospiraceae bacterium]
MVTDARRNQENGSPKLILLIKEAATLDGAVAFLIAFFELWFIDMLVYM